MSGMFTSGTVGKKLADQIRGFGVVGQWETKVKRLSSAIEHLVLEDAQSQRIESTPRAIKCSAPVKISWEGKGSAQIEIRRARHDLLEYDRLVGSPVQLEFVRPGKPSSRLHSSIVLPEPDLYRVKLYPSGRWSFIDPPYEWWLDLQG